MKTLNDLTPDQQSAYRIWQNKLKDHTLSKEQHDEARREIDELLWKGPNGKVLELKAEIAALQSRIERLELQMERVAFLAGIADDNLPNADDIEIVPTELTPIASETKDGLKLEVTAEVIKPKKENRGRKAARYTVEKDANSRWVILDRETGNYTDHDPYKTRKLAKAMANTLNNMPRQPEEVQAATPEKDPVEALIDSDIPVGGPKVVSRVTENPEETIIQTDVSKQEDPLADLGF